MSAPGPTPGIPPVFPPPISPPRSGVSRAALGAIAAIVVVVVIVSALFLTGVIPGFKSSSGAGSNGTSSEQAAASAAQTFANNTAGAPWSLVEAEGIDSTATQSIAVANFTNTSCPLVDSAISTITIPAYTGSYSSGVAEAWIMFYVSSTNTHLALLVQNGVTTEIGEVTAPNCHTNLDVAIPYGNYDSIKAGQALAAVTNVSTFIATHPQANASYLLWMVPYGAHGTNIPVWYTEYWACSGTETITLSGAVYASNNSVIASEAGEYFQVGQCGAMIPLGSAFAVGNPVSSVCGSGHTFAANGCTAGDHVYTVAVESSTIELNNVLFEVKTTSGSADMVMGSGGFAVLNVTGSVIAESAPLTTMNMSAAWVTYGTGDSSATPLSSLDTILIDVGTADPTGTGLSLVAFGENGYSGQTSPLPLP
jgi:hypothetical protein